MNQEDVKRAEAIAQGYFYGRQDAVHWLRSTRLDEWTRFAMDKLGTTGTFHFWIANLQQMFRAWMWTLEDAPKCPNTWHDSAPARKNMRCPECPA